MSTIQTSDFIIPNDPATIKQIQDACNELSASMTRAESEKIFQKEAVDDLSKATNIPKKHLKKLASLYHRQNKVEVEAENESTSELYERVFPQQ
jgi:AAA15 family ATPase/GTPase